MRSAMGSAIGGVPTGRLYPMVETGPLRGADCARLSSMQPAKRCAELLLRVSSYGAVLQPFGGPVETFR